MPALQARAAVFLAALWWGSLSGLGFVVVPLLFKHLGSPAEAGAMAAKLFSAQTWVSVACTMLLILMLNRKDALPTDSKTELRKVTAWALAGLLLALLVEFGVAAQIVNARASGGNLRLWHGLGSAMYLGQWLCAGLALWRLSSRP
jgi:hypothetical protein